MARKRASGKIDPRMDFGQGLGRKKRRTELGLYAGFSLPTRVGQPIQRNQAVNRSRDQLGHIQDVPVLGSFCAKRTGSQPLGSGNLRPLPL